LLIFAGNYTVKIVFMGKIPDRFRETTLFLGKLLSGKQYAFRGTTSLVLQGLEMNVDDIDLLTDKETALICNRLLGDYLIERVSYSQSNKFRSYFGRFKINNIPVEVMGEWQIKDQKGKWGDVFDASEDEIRKIEFNNILIRVTKIETELSMFAQMARWRAYHKIKRQIKEKDKEQRILF